MLTPARPSTQEIYYSSKRQGFLVECAILVCIFSGTVTHKLLLDSQGYAFKVITALDGLESLPDLVYPTREEQIELLQSVLLANESEADMGKDKEADSESTAGRSSGGAASKGGAAGKAQRVVGNLSALSGCVCRSLSRR